jgi:hypothetical protein
MMILFRRVFIFSLLTLGGIFTIAARSDDRLGGTLVIAVPVSEGLVVCSDKRLSNVDAGTSKDSAVKIRKVGNNALFVATNTVAFYDRKTRTNAFDAFETSSNYASRNAFTDGPAFWSGLKKEINDDLQKYFKARKFAEWPESDKANNNLLFNLIFYSVADNRLWSHSLKVFYEKKRTPVIFIPDPVREEVRTPKLSGKGRELMQYLARNPTAASDPTILRFDETRFNIQQTSTADAVNFARKLFSITSINLPKAQVSSTFDCAILDRSNGFRWLNTSVQ